MTTPNAALAYQVLDHIDAHPEQWNQGTWLRKGECGTTGCFAGTAVLLAGLRVEFDDYRIADRDYFNYRWVIGSDGEQMSVREAAYQALGITSDFVDEGLDDENQLFDGYNDREDLGRLVAEIFGPRPAVTE